jgi:hypothetical protein
LIRHKHGVGRNQTLSSIVLLAPMNVHHDLPIDILPAGSSGVCGLQTHKDTPSMHAFKGMYLYPSFISWPCSRAM